MAEIKRGQLSEIPKVCMVGEIARGATINAWQAGFGVQDIYREGSSIVCTREPDLESQKGHGYCPDPQKCPLARFPSRVGITIVK